jgi:drug/metabolite transporter (DMT)-like permease
VALIVLSLLCQLGAVLLLKQLALVSPVFSIVGTGLHPLFGAAIACLGVQAVLWQRVLARHPLAVVYPLNSMIYPASLAAGWVVFDEVLTLPRLAGSALILLGIWLMSERQAA